MAIHGSATEEIEAPIERVFEVAADVEGSPRWQPEIKRVDVLERDADGRQVLVHTESDAKVRRLAGKSVLGGVAEADIFAPPLQTSILLPVQTVTCPERASGALTVDIGVQVSDTGS